VKIDTRWVGNYCEVVLRDGNTTIEMGLLNQRERKELADTLIDAANALCGNDSNVILKCLEQS
jgi:hypothetical protein